MIDIIKQIEYVHRQLEDGDELKTVVLRRHYDADIEDLWDACTSAERISRWFLPVKGDLRLGGHYQLEGNAGGEVLECEPPHRFKVSWIFGDAPGLSEVEVRLSADGAERTLFELRHTAAMPPEMWDRFGPGAVGVGWDQGLLGLALHLTGGSIGDPIAWQGSEEGRTYSKTCSRLWGEAHEAAGAPADQAKAAADNTSAFYAPPA
ncbi:MULTISPECIES: SRPBCC family protein [unclassified Nonomuraea]|uniref:SRPBCC family protein n=1 Tax=unclassified Nonomuraea TaxID=2593643 RepID=UPI00340679B8